MRSIVKKPHSPEHPPPGFIEGQERHTFHTPIHIVKIAGSRILSRKGRVVQRTRPRFKKGQEPCIVSKTTHMIQISPPLGAKTAALYCAVASVTWINIHSYVQTVTISQSQESCRLYMYPEKADQLKKEGRVPCLFAGRSGQQRRVAVLSPMLQVFQDSKRCRSVLRVRGA